MTSTDEVWSKLQQVGGLPEGQGQVEAAEEAVALADACGDDELAVRARLLLVQAQYYVPRSAEHLTPIVWLLGARDRGIVPEWALGTVHWYLKWALSIVMEVPEIPRATMLEIYEDAHRRIVAAGDSLEPWYQDRTALALHLEGKDEARRWLAQWRAAERGRLSDCHACVVDDLARTLYQLDGPRAAIAAAAPVLEGDLDCHSQPEWLLARVAHWAAELGEVERVRPAHLRSYRFACRSEDQPSLRANTLRLLARTGNQARALRILREGFLDLGLDTTASTRITLLATHAAVIRAALEAGLDVEPFDGVPAAEAADRFEAQARAIAAKFVERDGTSYQMDTCEEMLSADQYPVRLDLSDLEPVASVAPQEPEADDDLADLPDDAVGLRELAKESRRRAPRIFARWAAVRDGYEATTPEELTAVAWLDLNVAANSPDPEVELPRALASAERSGDEYRIARARMEIALHEAAEGDELALERARVIAEQVEAGQGDEEVGGTLYALAGSEPDPQRRAALLGRAADRFEAAGLSDAAAIALGALADTQLELDPAPVAAILDRAEALCPDDETLLPLLLLESRGTLALMRGEPDEAREAWERGLAIGGHENVFPARQLRARLCRLLQDVGDHAALEEHGRSLLAQSTEAGDHLFTAFGQTFVAAAEAPQGRFLDAAERLEAAIPVLREHGHALLAMAMEILVFVRSQLGEHAGAAQVAAETAGLVEDLDHRAWLLMRASDEALAGKDAEAALEHAEAALEPARAAGDFGLLVNVLTSLVYARAATRDAASAEATARAAVAEVRDVTQRTGEPPATELDWAAVRLLHAAEGCRADAGESEEALALLDEMIALSRRSLLPVELMLRIERGDMLARLGRFDDGIQALREVLADAEHLDDAEERAARSRSAAGVLANILDHVGRTAEAQEVAGRYGIA